MTKPVTYYCPRCRRRVVRQVRRATATYRSFCGRTGKESVMRKVKE